MKILISPAKSLDYKTALPVDTYTIPEFTEAASHLNNQLKDLTKNEIKSLMKISDKLAELNYDRVREFNLPFTPENARPAIFTFSGDVYTGLDVFNMDPNNFDKLQDRLRILSGMYGILKPFDLMQAYRLEMGTRLKVDEHKNLYEYWGDTLTEHLNKEIKEDDLVINLASNEYFKSIKTDKLNGKLITPIFKDFKNGELKIISFYAKKARGSMVRFLIDNDISDLDGIRAFDLDGYAYSEQETADEMQPVFTR